MGMKRAQQRLWRQRIICFVLAAVCMVMIFYFSAQNGAKSDAISLPLASVLQNALHISTQTANCLVRNAAHLSTYLLLSVCLSGAFATYQIRVVVRVAVATGSAHCMQSAMSSTRALWRDERRRRRMCASTL